MHLSKFYSIFYRAFYGKRECNFKFELKVGFKKMFLFSFVKLNRLFLTIKVIEDQKNRFRFRRSGRDNSWREDGLEK